MARRHNREGGNDLDQEGNRLTTMEDIDGGLHPAVDGQSLDEDEDDVQLERGQWELLRRRWLHDHLGCSGEVVFSSSCLQP